MITKTFFHTGKVDPKDKDSDFIFNIYFDMSIYSVVTLIDDDYELDLSQGNFSELLGYDKSILSRDVVGRKVPNITRGVDWVICTAILSHAEQTMFQAMCYTVSQHQIFRLVIHFEKSRVGLSANL